MLKKIVSLSFILLTLFGFSLWGQTQLKVVSVSPEQNQLNVPVTSTVRVTLSDVLDNSATSADNLIVYSRKSGRIKGTLSYSIPTRTLVFTPTASFSPGDQIIAILNSNVTSRSNQHLQKSYVWQFTIQVLQGSYTFQTRYLLTGMENATLAAADFDGDGATDIAVAGTQNNRNLIKLSRLTGQSFSPFSQVELPFAIKPLYVADLDRNGRPDLIALHRNNFSFSVCTLSDFGIPYLTRTYYFNSTFVSPRSAAIGDINGDGSLDVVVLGRRNTVDELPSLYIFLNDGTGRLGINNRPSHSFCPLTKGEYTLIADFNLDGLMDIGFTQQASNDAFGFFLNTGNIFGFSGTPTTVPNLGGDLETAIAADLNGDRLVDLVTTDINSSQISLSTCQLLEGMPSFSRPAFFPATPNTNHMEGGDLDNDGDLDIATLSASKNVLALLQNTAGVLSMKKEVMVPSQPRQFVKADINRDGSLDLLVLNQTDTLTILQNKNADNHLPTVPLVWAPANGFYQSSLAGRFVWRAPDDADGDSLHFLFELSRDNSAPTTFDSRSQPSLFTPKPPVAGGIDSVVLSMPLPGDGIYQWKVQAHDGMGSGPFSEVRTLIVDRTAPVLHAVELLDANYQNWLNPLLIDGATKIKISYSELNPDSAILSLVGKSSPIISTDLMGGSPAGVELRLPINDLSDGSYSLSAYLRDKGGQSAQLITQMNIDQTPPSGTLITSENDTSSTAAIPLFILAGTDGAGSGLSGAFRIQVSINNGPWQIWQERTTAQGLVFQGHQNSRYAFEAAAYDQVGNVEPFQNIAEVFVYIDTTADDRSAPDAPRAVTANGSSPSPWSRENSFVISWQSPSDESGLKTIYFKFGSPPTSNLDFDSSEVPQPPLHVTSSHEGSMPLYLWFKDGRDNVDYRKTAVVLLRRDTIAPVLYEPSVMNAAFIDSQKIPWYNSKYTFAFQTLLAYDELRPTSMEVYVPWLNRMLSGKPLPSGIGVKTTISFTTVGAQDQIYELTFIMTDSAGNEGRRSWRVAFDQTPPSGCVAAAPIHKSLKKQFQVNWSEGQDGNGSGLSGKYDVYVRTGSIGWYKWQSDVVTTMAIFEGMHGHTYEFEAVNKDRTGNAESLRGIAEVAVEVDTTADDSQPPDAPLYLRAGGGSPNSPWQITPTFMITWQVPLDESGVVKSFYKLGAAPVNNADTTGSAAAAGPVVVTLTAEGQIPLYVWLKDKNGNVDYRNSDHVVLRYDKLPPQITEISARLPEPTFMDSRPRAWYNPKQTGQCNLQITFTETQPDSLIIRQIGLGADLKVVHLAGGETKTVTVPLTLQDKNDGRYTLMVTLRDAAAQVDTASFYLGLDSTPPMQIIASAVDTSSDVLFPVTWTKGVDQGSGTSGKYRVMVQENDLPWRTWLEETTQTSGLYRGIHGGRYRFEASGFDYMGLMEVLTGIAETSVVVDTTAKDKTPPPPPMNLRTSRSDHNFWQSNAEFDLLWDLPTDQSGLKYLYYKIGSAPVANGDYTGLVSANGPLVLTLTQEGTTRVYAWLMDRRNNVDYRNHVTITLGWDTTKPGVASLTFLNAGFGKDWYNPKIAAEATARLSYSEWHVDSVRVDCPALNLHLIFTQPKSGISAEQLFNVSLRDRADGLYLLTSTVIDSAGNSASREDALRLDGSPPTGVLASAPENSGSRNLTVSWSGGQDGAGVGLDVLYDVWVNDSGSGWRNWLSRTNKQSAAFSGEQGHRYEFEALGYDLLQNVEPLNGVAECATTIDTSLFDQTAPGPPINLTTRPTGWSTTPVFQLDWQNPPDASGISRALYKVGSPPLANTDSTGNWLYQPPVSFKMNGEGVQLLYVWLCDGRGNLNYKNYSMVTLQYDALAPSIDSLQITNAVYQGKWLNRLLTASASIKMHYSEHYPDSLRMYLPYSAGPISRAVTSAGDGKSLDLTIPLQSLAEGCQTIPMILTDKAGQIGLDSLRICVDGFPPFGSRATSAAVSISPEFEVSWTGFNAGHDGDGSGLSGEYDIRMRVDNGPWYLWQERTRRSTVRYIGVHGHRYAFEIAAWDNVGNRESFLDQAETVTLIDTALVDRTAPDPPKNIIAANTNSYFWQKTNEFLLSWENPLDPSSIVRVLWKVETPPKSTNDTSGSAPAVQPLRITARAMGGQMIYLWLVDGKGNSDYKKTGSYLMRYDSVAPMIDSVRCLSPTQTPDWYNQKKTGRIPFRLYFRESYPLHSLLYHSLLPEPSQSVVTPKGGVLQSELKVMNAKDGRYQIQITLSDSAGNVSPTAYLTLGLDSTPPRVSHSPLQTPVAEKTEISVQAIIRDENRVESASVQYWPAGSRFRATAALSRFNDTTFVGSIPASEVQSRGLEYAIWASDGLTLRREPAQEATPGSYSLRVRTVGEDNSGMHRPAAFTAGRAAANYHLVSIPIEADDPRVEAVFEDDLGGYDKSKWRLFVWNTASAAFDEYPNVGRVEPGRAFWLVTSVADIILDSGPGVSVPVQQPYSIPLKKGWNDIANPFAFTIDWQDIFHTTGADTEKIIGPYAFDGRWRLPFEVAQMKPWEGYSFYLDQPAATLKIPALETAGGLLKTQDAEPFPQAEWFLSVAAWSQGVLDDNNYLGVHKAAKSARNYPEPYPVGEYVSLYFTGNGSVPMTTDFRPQAEGYVWDVKVTTSWAHKPVKLTFQRSQRLPETLSLGLWDEQDQVWINLKQDSVYYFISAERDSARRFQLLAGSSRFMAEQAKTGLPLSTQVLQNYPNPFNEQTMIAYQLAKAGRIEISIYNILGQKVRQVYSGIQSAGRKQWLWDGRDQNGQPLGSGVYFLQMQGPDLTAQRKMIYLR